MGYYDWCHINAQGFRGLRSTDVDARGAFRIMAVGASTTFDSFVTSDENAWPAVLERDLAAGGRRIEVLNAGVPGYFLWQNTLRLSTELARYRPEVLLLLHGHNELGDVLRWAVDPDDERSDRPAELTELPWTTWLDAHSALYRRVRSKWAAIQLVRKGRDAARRSPLTAEQWRRTIDEGALAYERELETFVATARAHGIRVGLLEMVHVTDPSATDETDPALRREWEATIATAPVDVILDAYRAFNAAADRVAARNGTPLVPTTQFGIFGANYYSEGDPIHFNDAGAHRMAEQLAATLDSMGVLETD